MFNLIAVKLYDPVAQIEVIDTAGTYTEVVIAALNFAGEREIYPMDAKNVVRFAPYAPLEAWSVFEGTERVAMMAVQEAE